MRRSLTSAAGLAAIACLLAAPASAQDPYEMEDDTWISIDGTVEAVEPGEFTLDYGDGTVLVEIDEPGEEAHDYQLMEGVDVRVRGMIDDDFLDETSIQARSVFVKDLNTEFYTSAADQDDEVAVLYEVGISRVVLQGVVTAVGEDEFMLGTDTRAVTVSTELLANDPLDEEGFQKIEAGDRVLVTGQLEPGLFETGELVAETVTTIRDPMKR